MSQATMPDPEKVTSVWFDDGNVIVIAEPKVFRLHQSLLAQRSPIFSDMLSIPQPDAAAAIAVADRRVIDALQLDVTGCAVVRFTDKPQEVEWFLTAFFHGSHIEQYSGNTSALAGILRLATKYEVKFLGRWSLDCLEKLYPFATDVDGDDLRQTVGLLSEDLEWMNGMFTLIEVAMTVGVPWVLPQVYWRLHNIISVSRIMHHSEWAEFPEERKTKFLFAHNYSQEMRDGPFQRVLSLYHSGMVHGPTPADTECVETFRKTLHQTIGKKGRGATHGVLWQNYADESACAECKQRYAAMRRDDYINIFLTIQERNGLPAPADMKELREKYYEQSFMHE